MTDEQARADLWAARRPVSGSWAKEPLDLDDCLKVLDSAKRAIPSATIRSEHGGVREGALAPAFGNRRT